ncbi:CGNR zinc finger domain-containing protein [Microbacterium sp. EST19A]|uniref:CGNR zinc finger domain-containing protein n=1 Tax=Microbacterium sp. EST19A TaxID=2862681 RepID=UPI001CC038F5|nr:CGNR zinc finger domain-containing protein [Microbacterium sp. EST19A]
MHLNPYGEYAVLLAASLANDWPETRAGIEERTLELGMTQTFPAAPDDHARIRVIVDDWLKIVDEPDADARAELLNAELAAAAAYPRLTNHDGEGWHLHYRDDVQSLPYVVRAIINLGTSLHLVTRGMSRLGRCQAPPCTNVVADVTRNGRQRFCSVRCANRAAVRRHRARVA